MELLGLRLAAWSIILVSLVFTVLWVQVVILHYRGAYYRIWMWEPVIYLPVIVVLGTAAVTLQGVFLQVYGVALMLSFLMGLSGLFFHIQGIVRKVGGWSLDNIMVGPPPMYPLSISVISLIGIIAALLWE